MASELPMFSPNKRAKLYTRYTFNESIENATDIITYEKNEYVCYKTFKWIDVTESTRGEYQPVPGLMVETESVTIKTNSLYKFKTGELVMLENKLWIIEDGITSSAINAPKRKQAFQYLPLKKIL